MARKRRIFLFTVFSFLKESICKQTVKYLIVGTFSFSLLILFNSSVLSASKTEITQPLQLAQQGQKFYEAGQLDRAVESWQKAADAYQAKGDSVSATESLLNTATAQQGLGLYPKSCQTILAAFGIEDLNCKKLRTEAVPIEQKLAGLNLQTSNRRSQVATSIEPILKQPDSLNKAIGLLRFGDFWRETGYLQMSQETLKMSLDVAKNLDSPEQESAALLSLGNTTRAIAKDRQSRFPPITTAFNIIANQRGSVKAAIAPYQSAIDFYDRAANVSPSPLNRIEAQLNQLSLLVDIQEFWQMATQEVVEGSDYLGIEDRDFRDRIVGGAQKLSTDLTSEIALKTQSLSEQIQAQLSQLSVNRAAIYAKINFAQSLLKLKQGNSTIAPLLTTAIKETRLLNNSRLEAQTLGLLAQLYQQNQQWQEARQLTEDALRLAPASEAPEIAYIWQRQLGSILKEQGDKKGAIAAYDSSFNTIRALRNDLVSTDVEPIYREYVSLLLDSDPRPEQLNKARDVLESLQVAELDNFFRDPCSQTADEPVLIDNVDKQAAVIYPIILPDRLEVILTLPGQDLFRYSSPINRVAIENTITELRRKALTNPGYSEQLRGTRGNEEQLIVLRQSLEQSLAQDIQPLANQLYQWLLAPAEAKIQASGVKTLVFVLDGPLRNIPMALLYDGQKYLIEKEYNIALTSGLQLTASQPLAKRPIRVLAAGVTKELPQLKLPPIPQVAQELKSIGQIFPNSEILLDKDFTRNSLRKQLEKADFPVVHLATHGQFSSTSDQTFIVSGDEPGKDLINVKDLDTLLRTRSQTTNPIELLVLSACNTAEGDNRAILGLAGVAVRAGARSTIATLWGANDEATAQLMGYFYRNLASDTEITKAKALREAQLTLLKTDNSLYKHPYYWAPFVLVGNWL